MLYPSSTRFNSGPPLFSHRLTQGLIMRIVLHLFVLALAVAQLCAVIVASM
jgi:hypothetical protein